MQIQKSYRIMLLMVCFLFGILSVEATHFKENTPNPENSKIERFDKEKVKAFFKSIFSKSDKQKTDDEKTIRKWSNLSLWIGLGSILFLILGFSGAPALLAVAIVAGIVGFFIARKALQMIKNSDNPEQYSGERIKSIIGKVSSLISTLVIPIGLLALFLALLSL